MVLTGRMDYHVHTAVTVDGKMNETQACEQALAMGVREMAFTNHSMLTEPPYTITAPALVAHWEQIQQCQRRYPELKLRLGLELDYYPDRDDEITAVIRQYEQAIERPFDLVLGSIHHLNGVFFSSKVYAPQLYQGADTVKLYHDYFALATRAVRSRLYDVMAHPDLIKKYTDVFSPRVPFAAYRDAAATYVDALLDCNVGIELNTKGPVLPVGELYPSDNLLNLYLSRARARGIQPIITLGSDAHKVADVGARISDAEVALSRSNCSTVTLFEYRQRIPERLGDAHDD